MTTYMHMTICTYIRTRRLYRCTKKHIQINLVLVIIFKVYTCTFPSGAFKMWLVYESTLILYFVTYIDSMYSKTTLWWIYSSKSVPIICDQPFDLSLLCILRGYVITLLKWDFLFTHIYICVTRPGKTGLMYA